MADVFVVDDDHAIRSSVRAVLEDEGCTVDEATHGCDAMQHRSAGLRHPQLILFDLELLRCTSQQTLEVLARPLLAAHQHQVIVLTASVRDMPPVFAHIPLLRKPFDLEELIRYVNEAAQRLAVAASGASSREEIGVH